MMRYQRVSPDCVPLTSNGKKPNGVSIHQTPPQSTTNANSSNNDLIASSSSSFEPNKAFRFRSPSRTPDHNHHHFDHNNNVHHHIQQQHELSPSDMLLQWGHRKRPRASRTEIRALTDDSSSSSSVQVRQQQQPPLKSQRRHVGPTGTTPSASMPPPPPPLPLPLPPTTTAAIPSSSSNGRARKEASGPVSLHNRNLEDRSGAMNGSSPLRHSGGGSNRAASRSTTGKRSPPPEKNERKSSSSAWAVHEKPNGSSATQTVRSNPLDSALLMHHHEQENNNTNTCSAPKEPVVEVLEWPKIQIALSRKEKEEDFFAMRGSKLPQRPKKRPKNVERALQYGFPGLWLADVTMNRYEVREKKCVKKQKRRGLKGMESVESDSE